jgi:DNA replication protein DnaC
VSEAGQEPTPACIFCDLVIAADEKIELRNPEGATRDAHQACWRRQKSMRDCSDLRRRENLKFSWGASRSNALTNCPKNWDFARFDNAEFMRRVSRKVADGVSKWTGEVSLFVSGPTGIGKTALIDAWLHRRYEQFEKDVAARIARQLNFAFISGPNISGCRRRGKIGEESKLVELAIATPLLILDELGYEPLSEELLLIVDERHKRSAPTVTTTGRTLESFAERYGGSVFRKLTEGGTIVEGWK